SAGRAGGGRNLLETCSTGRFTRDRLMEHSEPARTPVLGCPRRGSALLRRDDHHWAAGVARDLAADRSKVKPGEPALEGAVTAAWTSTARPAGRSASARLQSAAGMVSRCRTLRTAPKPLRRARSVISPGVKDDSHGSPRSAEACATSVP